MVALYSGPNLISLNCNDLPSDCVETIVPRSVEAKASFQNNAHKENISLEAGNLKQNLDAEKDWEYRFIPDCLDSQHRVFKTGESIVQGWNNFPAIMRYPSQTFENIPT